MLDLLCPDDYKYKHGAQYLPGTCICANGRDTSELGSTVLNCLQRADASSWVSLPSPTMQQKSCSCYAPYHGAIGPGRPSSKEVGIELRSGPLIAGPKAKAKAVCPALS